MMCNESDVKSIHEQWINLSLHISCKNIYKASIELTSRNNKIVNDSNVEKVQQEKPTVKMGGYKKGSLVLWNNNWQQLSITARNDE